LLARLEDEYLFKGFRKLYYQLIYIGKTLPSRLPKNSANYQPLFEKAGGNRAFPTKTSQTVWGREGKGNLLLGYKEYLEKTFRAHRNCTLFNARNRGTFLAWKDISSVYFHY